jgi:hypothetical protein
VDRLGRIILCLRGGRAEEDEGDDEPSHEHLLCRNTSCAGA